MKMSKKVLFVATVVKTHIAAFHLPILKLFKEMGWETAVAARNDYEDPEECHIPYCDIFYDIPFSRAPFRLQNLKAAKKLKKLIEDGEYDIIHCHTPVGGVLTRWAARSARKRGTRVLYTAHGFHFYRGAPLLNWVLYYPIEKRCSVWTDTLITINEEDFRLAKAKMHAKNTVLTPGVGISLARFQQETPDRASVRRSLGIPQEAKLLIYVAELSPNKNQTSLLDMMKALLRFREDAMLLLVGTGNAKQKLERKAHRLGISDKVIFAGYREDIPSLLKASDACVPSSIREGLGMGVIEAMACGVPVVAYDNRGHRTIIQDGVTGHIVPNGAHLAMAQTLHALLNDPRHREALSRNALARTSDYSIEAAVKTLKIIYRIGDQA